MANAQARSELQALADEQAALRRVATLVARHASPAEAMATIAEEVGTLLEVDGATILRFETDSTASVVAGWGAPGLAELVGRRLDFHGDNPTAAVFSTGRPARQEDWSSARGPFAEISRTVGITAAVAAPIVVEGRLWGTIVVVTLAGSSLPADTETRIGQFTELVATAIGNVNARAELTASRARIVRTGDNARRRFERDLHDGVQQRLVSLALELRGVEAVLAADPDTARAGLAAVREGLAEALDHLQELSRGLHPAILSQGGLEPALKALARRAAVAVRLDVHVADRVGEEVEVATYYVVSEAITNAVKHARASLVEVRVRRRDATVEVEVRDDGVGGADPTRGSGLVGLRDRVEALGGELTVHSPQGHGTWLHVGLPAPARASPPD
jgi:signal transduction histidine kinase